MASSRVAEFAFKFAVDNGRSKVSAVHKANIMKRADGLFIQCCREVSEKYPQIEYEELIVDNACMQVSSSMSLNIAAAASHNGSMELCSTGYCTACWQEAVDAAD